MENNLTTIKVYKIFKRFVKSNKINIEIITINGIQKKIKLDKLVIIWMYCISTRSIYSTKMPNNKLMFDIQLCNGTIQIDLLVS